LRVDLIVLAVCTDEADVNHAVGIVDPDDNAIFVTRDVKYDPPIPENAGATYISFDCGRA
jgi:hypothetical protein